MAGKASGTGSPRGRRIRSACSADRFALVVLCASSQAFWTSYHGARPASCSRIPSWDTVNRSLEGVASTGGADEDGAEVRGGVFCGPLIAVVGFRCPGVEEVSGLLFPAAPELLFQFLDAGLGGVCLGVSGLPFSSGGVCLSFSGDSVVLLFLVCA